MEVIPKTGLTFERPGVLDMQNDRWPSGLDRPVTTFTNHERRGLLVRGHGQVRV